MLAHMTPPVLVVIVCWTLLLAQQVMGDKCKRKYPQETDGVNELPIKETTHECAYGCCYKYSYPCCDAPFYTGTAFVITVGCSAIVPLVMGVTLCLLMRSRKRQQRQRQARREERRRQRQMQRAAHDNDIFFTSGEHGPQVMLGPPRYASSNPISPPEYSEVVAESPPSSPGSPPPVVLPPPPPYTPGTDNNYATTITITTTDDNNNNNNNNNGGNSSSSDSDESDKGGDNNNITITT